MDIDLERAPKIAALNDEYRKAIPMSVTITNGVYSLPDLSGLLQAVREFDHFMEDDPYSEHDFGSLEWHGETVFWKIDYYDRHLGNWHDPLDVLECERVLTVLLASEY